MRITVRPFVVLYSRALQRSTMGFWVVLHIVSMEKHLQSPARTAFALQNKKLFYVQYEKYI